MADIQLTPEELRQVGRVPPLNMPSTMTLLQHRSSLVLPHPVSIPPPTLILIRTHGVLGTCVTQIYIRPGIHHRELPPLGWRRILRKLLSRVLVPSCSLQMYAIASEDLTFRRLVDASCSTGLQAMTVQVILGWR